MVLRHWDVVEPTAIKGWGYTRIRLFTGVVVPAGKGQRDERLLGEGKGGVDLMRGQGEREQVAVVEVRR